MAQGNVGRQTRGARGRKIARGADSSMRVPSLEEMIDHEERTTMKQDEHSTTTQQRAYRALEPGERALRHTCPDCGDRHAALLDVSSGAAQCRQCGSSWFAMTSSRK
jgi:predicted RNA-binding Zn-ribbon protein involved in translation (DUF1610 family)